MYTNELYVNNVLMLSAYLSYLFHTLHNIYLFTYSNFASCNESTSTEDLKGTISFKVNKKKVR